MKTLHTMTAALALLVGAGAANAADVYSSGGMKDPVTSALGTPATWSGFYLGVNGGWADSGSRDNGSATLLDNGALFADGATLTAADLKQASPSGLFGGAQAGYLFQRDAFVIGVETDFQGGDISGSASTDVSGIGIAYNGQSGSFPIQSPNSLVMQSKQSIDWFGTLRGRVGAAFDKFLVYGTGGLAYGNVRDELRGTFSDGVNSVSGGVSHNETRTGYAAGGGVEYKIGNWSAAFEYLHVDLGDAAISAPLSVIYPGNTTATKLGTLTTTSIPSDFDTFKVKINYHLN